MPSISCPPRSFSEWRSRFTRSTKAGPTGGAREWKERTVSLLSRDPTTRQTRRLRRKSIVFAALYHWPLSGGPPDIHPTAPDNGRGRWAAVVLLSGVSGTCRVRYPTGRSGLKPRNAWTSDDQPRDVGLSGRDDGEKGKWG